MLRRRLLRVGNERVCILNELMWGILERGVGMYCQMESKPLDG